MFGLAAARCYGGTCFGRWLSAEFERGRWMSEHLDDGVGGRLEQVVRQRLQRGQSPADLALELGTRMTPEAADQLIARAMQGVEVEPVTLRPQPYEFDTASRRALVGVGIWSGLLVLQNLTVTSAVFDYAKGAGWHGELGRMMLIVLVLAILKACLLPMSLWMFVTRRTTFALCAAAALILYMQPLHIFIEPRLDLSMRLDPLSVLLSVSSFLSYASVGALAFVWWRVSKRPADIDSADIFA